MERNLGEIYFLHGIFPSLTLFIFIVIICVYFILQGLFGLQPLLNYYKRNNITIMK